MKIVFITNLFEPFARGGAEKIVKKLADEAVERGDEVAVITARPFFCRDDQFDSRDDQFVSRGESRNSRLASTGMVIRFFPWNLYFVGNDFKYPVFIRFFWHIFDAFNIFSYFKIKKILRELKPDLVWTHNLKGIGLLTPIAIRHSQIKHRHTLHDVQLIIPSGLLLFGEEQSWKHNNFFVDGYVWITKKLFGSPNEVFSPSQWLLDFYREHGFFEKSKCEVRKNPVSVCHPEPFFCHPEPSLCHPEPFFCHPKERSDEGSSEALPTVARSFATLRMTQEKLRMTNNGQEQVRMTEEQVRMTEEQVRMTQGKLRVTDNGYSLTKENMLNFLYVGQIEQHKGIFFLVDAWKQLNHEDTKEMKLIILGNGTRGEELKTKIAKCNTIQFFGKKSSEEVVEYYQKSDYLIFPTLCYENSPNVIHEALSSGLPVIASNLGSISEFIKDGGNGFLFAPGNSESLLSVLRKIIK